MYMRAPADPAARGRGGDVGDEKADAHACASTDRESALACAVDLHPARTEPAALARGVVGIPQSATTLAVDELARTLSDAMRDAMACCNTPSDGQLQRMMARTLSKDLPTFSGNAEEWPIFSTMLRTTTEQCGFSNVENMLRLQKALKGRARDLVLPLLTVAENTPPGDTDIGETFWTPRRGSSDPN